jgi:hypothetical protein
MHIRDCDEWVMGGCNDGLERAGAHTSLHVTNLTSTVRGLNQGLQCEKAASNCLNL